MKVAISGSRTFNEPALVDAVIERLLARGDFIIIGDAPSGVDAFAYDYLESVPSDRFRRERAEWKRWGGYAGHERNGRMLFDADELVAIFADGDLTPGTLDAVDQASKKGIPIYVYHDGQWTTHSKKS